LDTSHWWLDSATWHTITETGGNLRLSGAADESAEYSTASFGLNTYSLVLPDSFAVDSELSLVQSPTIFKVYAGSDDLGLYGGGNGDYKNIGFWQAGIGWTKLGQSTINTGLLNRQKLSVTYTGPTDSRTVRWMENGNLEDVRAVRIVSSPAFGYFSYGPDTVASFDVHFDNIRIRNYTFPEPMVSVGTEITSGARVSMDDQPCDNVMVLNGGNLTCTIPPHPVGTAEVTITNPNGQTFTLTRGFTYYKAYPAYLPLVRR